MNVSRDYRTLWFLIFLLVVCGGIVLFFEAILASLHLLLITHPQPNTNGSPTP